MAPPRLSAKGPCPVRMGPQSAACQLQGCIATEDKNVEVFLKAQLWRELGKAAV